MAIDFPSSPTNGQTFTSGSVTYTWDGTKWTAVAAAGSSNSISQGNTNATVTDTGSDGRFVVTTEGSERLRVDSSGRLGLGTTTPESFGRFAVRGATTVATWGDTSAHFSDATTGSLYVSHSSNRVSLKTDADLDLFCNNDDSIIFSTNAIERGRFDASGRLLVGTSSNRATNITGTTNNVVIESAGSWASLVLATNQNAGSAAYQTFLRSRGTTAGSTTIVQNGDGLGYLSFEGTDGSNPIPAAWISAHVDGTPGANDMPGRLVFSTTADGASSPTERMRIGNSGDSALYTQNTGGTLLNMQTAASAGTSASLITGTYGATAVLTGTVSIRIWSNGNIQNTNNSYGALSDIKLKENIADAGSQWADLKALRVCNYNLKEGQTHRQIGLIAQEVELISPGLVYESPDRDAEGNDLGTVTKSVNYSVLYMKAVKALQEAMERIETLEARVAALESA